MSRLTWALGLLIACVTAARAPAQNPSGSVPPVSATGPGSLTGIAYDSLRGGVVTGAIIQLITPGKAPRETLTQKDGRFRFDSVASGTYSLQMLHATLDTLGFVITSPTFPVTAGIAQRVNVSIPSTDRLVPLLCTPTQIARGPSAIVGFVRDPDSRVPVAGATVQLDATNADAFTRTRVPLVRTTTTDARGQFRICGLPAIVTGKVVASRGGISSGEVPVEIRDIPLVLRGVSFSLTNRAVTVVDDGGHSSQFLQGNARLTGKVVNDKGLPLADARVAVLGTQASTKTNAAGQFSLDSLPAGSVTVQIIAMGYGVTERSVDIASTDPPTSATLTMDRFVQALPAQRTVGSAHETGLEKVGYLARKKSSIGGVQKDGDDLNQMASRVTEMLRDIPGLKITRVDTGDSQDNMISTTAGGLGSSCIDLRVDRIPFRDSAGELDRELQADVVEAIEYYDVASIPGDWFGRSRAGCALLLIWTRSQVPHGGGGGGG